MLWLSRTALVIAGWGAMLLMLGYLPGVMPLPNNLVDDSVLVAAGSFVLTFAVLKSKWALGPVVLWRHRPSWWRVPIIVTLAAIAVAVATRAVYPELSYQRTGAAFIIAFASLAAVHSAAAYAAEH